MAPLIRCLKCSKIIECSPYDRAILLEHIRTDHPEISLPDDDMMEPLKLGTLNSEDTSPTQEEKVAPQRISTPRVSLPPEILSTDEDISRSLGPKPIYTRKYKVRNPVTPPRSPQKRRLYKTSVEKWRPGKGTIYCPKCGANKRPIIRSRTEKMSYSTVGAACVLTCWPLCFLPCLFTPPPKDFLHCANCNNFLGMYDKQSNCFRPNREFVDDVCNDPSTAGATARSQYKSISCDKDAPIENITIGESIEERKSV